MFESIKVFENSLRDYLINVQHDAYNSVEKIEYKYNNLKVYMDPQKSRTPHFWISLNIVAACYSINPVEKISGTIGNDDKYIYMWASRANINGALKRHWDYLIEVENAINTNSIEKQKELAESEEDEDVSYASEIITGVGSAKLTHENRPKIKKLKIKKIKLKPVRVKILNISKGMKK